jgi:predicted DNA-binding protein
MMKRKRKLRPKQHLGIPVRLSKQIVEALDRIGNHVGRTRASLAREFLLSYLRTHQFID